MNTKTKKKQNNYIDQNPVEAITNIGTGIRQSIVDDLLKGGVNDAWEKLLGGSSKDKSRNAGDLEEGQEIDLKIHGESEKREHAAPAMNYHLEIVETEKRANHEDQKIIQSQIQEIQIELEKISKTSAEVALKFKQVTVEQRIESPGKYHVTFLQGFLNFARKILMEVQDSGAWTQALQSKRKQKGYWQMFKKHGTSFGLSNERVVSTQVG